MKILHFFGNSKFLGSYLHFLQKNYDVNEHHFFSWNENRDDVLIEEELIKKFQFRNISRNSMIEAYNAVQSCCEYDLIILHSLFLPFNLMFSFSLNRKFLLKTVWCIWGGDLSNYIGPLDYKRKLWSVLRNRIINRLGYVITTNIEYDLLVKNFHVSPVKLDAFYPYLAEQISIPPLNLNNDKDIRIFLGNYATPVNRHIETLHILSKYKDRPLKIFIPLSYGDMNYAKRVSTVANDIFGEKAIVLNDFINREDYGKLLSTMDIGIINSVKQNALGSFFSLLLAETKIYTDPDGCVWDILANELEIKLYPVNEIFGDSFDEFSSSDPRILLNNKEKAQSFVSNENFKKQWDIVFQIQEKTNDGGI